MHPNTASLLFLLILLLHHIRATPSICNVNNSHTTCPLGIAANPFLSPVANKLPNSNMVQLVRTTQNDLQFKVPFCRNCGFFFSFVPNVDTQTYPLLLSESNTLMQLTSLNAQMTHLRQGNSNDWSSFWGTGNSLCDADSQQKQFGVWTSNNSLASQTIHSPCESLVSVKHPSALLMNQYPNIFSKVTRPNEVEYRGNLHIQSVYPFDLNSPGEGYATTIKTLPLTFKFDLQARLRLNQINLFKEKEILVTTTQQMPFVLQVNFEVEPKDYSTFLNLDSCHIDPLKDEFGMKIASQKAKLGGYDFQVVATKERGHYKGEFTMLCEGYQCDHHPASDERRITRPEQNEEVCSALPEPVQVNLQVDQTRPREIITTTRFTPQIDLYSGSKLQPFKASLYDAQNDRNLLVSSSVDYVSFGIKTNEVGAADFRLVVNHLRMCAPTCVSEDLEKDEHNKFLQLVLIQNGKTSEEIEDAAHRWFRLWQRKDFLQFGHSDTGEDMSLYTAGWSLDVDALKSFKHTTYTFEIELRWIPIAHSSGLAAGISSQEYYENAVLLKTFELMESDADSSQWYRDTSVLVSLSAGGGIFVLSCTVIIALALLAVLIMVCVCCCCADREDRIGDRNSSRQSMRSRNNSEAETNGVGGGVAHHSNSPHSPVVPTYSRKSQNVC